MHKILDIVPERCGPWKTTTLTFPGKEESFVVHHRDPLEAIRALWGDPSLASDLVYKPSRIFRDESRETRVYNEMWTGKWWWAAQVSSL
jgi:hypothetical protein